MTVKHNYFYVSDKAYDTLIALAKQQNYVQRSLIRPRGLSEFLEALSNYRMQDTRPDSEVERHLFEISTHHAPIWASYYLRRARALTLYRQSTANYIHIALQMGIIREEAPWTIGGPNRLNPTSVIGYVLESIGLGWITPVTLPNKLST